MCEQMEEAGYRPEGTDIAIPLALSAGIAVWPHDHAARMEVVEHADERLRRNKTGADDLRADDLRTHMGRSLEGFSMLDALVTAVDNKDRYTRHHSEDVLAYSLQIADGLGMDEKTRRTIAVAALLHDVGKIGVPDKVLRKPGRLTGEEFEAVQNHPMMGAIIVGAIPGLEDTLDAVRHHHERWDGGGYPFGLSGEETPLIARLMAVADAFSAMTTDRPYRKGMPREKALAILADGAGTQWDPVCVQTFLRSQIPRPDTSGMKKPGSIRAGGFLSLLMRRCRRHALLKVSDRQASRDAQGLDLGSRLVQKHDRRQRPEAILFLQSGAGRAGPLRQVCL